MKPFYLLLLLFACSNIAPDQKSIHYANKGITCDAFQDGKGQAIICGETSVYTSEKNNNGLKDAFFVVSPDFGKTNTGYSLNIQNTASRFERMVPAGNDFILNGFYGDNKNKFLIKTNAKGDAIWGIRTEKFRVFDPGNIAMDVNGNLLFMSKDPSSDSYHGTIHLIDKDGNWIWSKDLSSVEIMQDIISTKDGRFLLSYKQKGAYIDGSTRKKYWMNSFHKIDASGQMLWSRKFHLDNELVDDCVFSKLMEDKTGNIYFLGKMILLKTRKQSPFITKTDKEGHIIWSNVYVGTTELNIRNACFDATGNLMLVADGYTKNGGLAFMQIAPDGTFNWAKLTKSANYEQAINLFTVHDGYEVVWDKLLNFAAFTFNAKGQSCSSKFEDLKLTTQKFPLLLDEYKGKWDTAQADWKKMEFNLVAHRDVTSVSDCQ